MPPDEIFYFSTKTYVVDTQKNRLIINETVLLNIQTHVYDER